MKRLPKLPKISKCFGCGLCSDVCPKNAISIELNKNGFLVPRINKNNCVRCYLCEKKCPSLSYEGIQINNRDENRFYKAWSKNAALRLKSSSGGVFTQLAFDFLKNKNSVIIGAAIDDEHIVKHVIIKSQKDLFKLQGTKYRQSNTSQIYINGLVYLKRGYNVLFSGTPCQVAAMQKYIFDKKYDGTIFFIEVICHGVPSSIILDMSIKYENAKGIYAFRTKDNGWSRSQRMVYIDRDNKLKEIQQREKDLFYMAFLNNMNLRKSCYQCPFAKLPRIADISLGDFWGCKDADNIEDGVSLLLINNSKGEKLLNENLFLEKVICSDILRENYPVYKSLGNYFSFSSYIFFFKYIPCKIALRLLSTSYEKKWSHIFYYVWHKIFYFLNKKMC